MSDRERPPVLAHQRFAAERERFAHMDIAQRFASIHVSNLWGAETSVSGLGSEAEPTLSLQRQMPALLRKIGVQTLLDAPCGDAGWIAGLDLRDIHYIGVDIVPALIAKNIHKHASLGTFVLADITGDPLPPADAILCRDCLVHLSFAHIRLAVDNFRRSGARWLLATTFLDWQRNCDCEDGDWRALNMTRPPFDWPPPVDVLNEGCEEAGGGWRDKSLALWDLQHLPVG